MTKLYSQALAVCALACSLIFAPLLSATEPAHPAMTDAAAAAEHCPHHRAGQEKGGCAHGQHDACPHGVHNGQHSTMHRSHAADHQGETHACPMHPKVTGVAGDECPKCGMTLEALSPPGGDARAHNNHSVDMNAKSSAETHACPMHPKITGVADDECPICGMKLEPVDIQAVHGQPHRH